MTPRIVTVIMADVPPTSLLPTLVRLVPELPVELRSRREAGASYAELTTWLRDTHGVDVRERTVARWMHTLDGAAA